MQCCTRGTSRGRKNDGAAEKQRWCIGDPHKMGGRRHRERTIRRTPCRRRESRHDARWLAFLVTYKRTGKLCPILPFSSSVSLCLSLPPFVFRSCSRTITGILLAAAAGASRPPRLVLSPVWHVISTFVYVSCSRLVSLLPSVDYRVFSCSLKNNGVRGRGEREREWKGCDKKARFIHFPHFSGEQTERSRSYFRYRRQLG